MSYRLLIFISILGWGVGSLCSKLATNIMHPIMISVIVMATDFLLLPLAFIFLKFDKTVPPMGLFLGIAIAILMTMGTLGFSFALKSGGDAGVVTTMTALYPSLTFLLSAIFLKESVTLPKIIGVTLAIISAFCLSQ
jgi:bacterial/archaeal transporter family protein